MHNFNQSWALTRVLKILVILFSAFWASKGSHQTRVRRNRIPNTRLKVRYDHWANLWHGLFLQHPGTTNGHLSLGSNNRYNQWKYEVYNTYGCRENHRVFCIRRHQLTDGIWSRANWKRNNDTNITYFLHFINVNRRYPVCEVCPPVKPSNPARTYVLLHLYDMRRIFLSFLRQKRSLVGRSLTLIQWVQVIFE